MAKFRVVLDAPEPQQDVVKIDLESVTVDWGKEVVAGFFRYVDAAGVERRSDRFEISLAAGAKRTWMVNTATQILQLLQNRGDINAGDIVEE